MKNKTGVNWEHKGIKENHSSTKETSPSPGVVTKHAMYVLYNPDINDIRNI